jgi:hypothetical protein
MYKLSGFEFLRRDRARFSPCALAVRSNRSIHSAEAFAIDVGLGSVNDCCAKTASEYQSFRLAMLVSEPIFFLLASESSHPLLESSHCLCERISVYESRKKRKLNQLWFKNDCSIDKSLWIENL